MTMMTLVDAALLVEEPIHLTAEPTRAKDHAATHLNAPAEVASPAHVTVATRLLARKGAGRGREGGAGRCLVASRVSLAASIRDVQASPAEVCDAPPTVVVVVVEETKPVAAETRTETAPADFV